MARRSKSPINIQSGPTRQFFLSVNPIIFHPTESKDKNVISHQVGNGIYFYMSKSYRLDSTKTTVQKLSSTMASHITQLIQKESQQLIKFWYNNVNHYFNRRAYGVQHSGKFDPKKMRARGKVRTPYIANSRQHTGQLRRSLTINKINIYGAELYAKRVHAKTDNRDYIDILMGGAQPGPRAYNPFLDLRVKTGEWKGIPSSYWAAWQSRFLEEVKRAEQRLNRQIENYVEKMQILGTKEIRAARNNRHNKEFINTVSADEKNFSIEMKKPRYNQKQGQMPMDSPYDFEETWEGMKTKYYGEAIPANNLSWTVDLNTVIRTEKQRRRGGRRN